MKTLLLASACALACAATPSLAEGLSARVGGDFGNIAGAPYWDVNGSVELPILWNDFAIEGDLGDSGASHAGIGFHDFDGGGARRNL